MSEEREISMRKHDKTEVVSCQSVLGTHQIKGIRSKLVICHGNTLSLVISMAQSLFRKKRSQKNFELDYTFLLEASIKCNVLTFTDDKTKRYEINYRLGRIAGKSCSRLQQTRQRNNWTKMSKNSMCLKIN